MITIHSLPHEILFQVLLQYADYASRLEFASCCLEWVNLWLKKCFRKLIADAFIDQNGSFDAAHLHQIKEKLYQVISNPSQQLKLSLLRNHLQPLLPLTDYCFEELECRGHQLLPIIQSVGRLKVRRLFLFEWDALQYQEIQKHFSKLVDCSSLTLASDRQRFSSTIAIHVSPWISNLHHVLLYGVMLTDVSMLGSIPYLVLRECQQLVDISSLNKNDHVVIEGCNEIQDYSHSFANSRKIFLVLCTENNSTNDHFNYTFDFTRWTKVEELRLFSFRARPHLIFQNNQNQLPKTIKRCSLEGLFVSSIDFTVTSDHKLQEITLKNDGTITSLDGYGFERVAIISCRNMTALSSLEGLGRGRNRKIIISECHKIIDFSPLNHLPIVKIEYCRGFTDSLQVRFVRDLGIMPCEWSNFSINLLLSCNVYEHISSLTLSKTFHMKDFDGLQKIPQLQVDCCGLYWIEKFLKAGKKPQNQRIILDCCTDFFFKSREKLPDVHEQYMKDDYDHYKSSKYWVWVRKL